MHLIGLSAFNLVAAHGGVGRASRATGRPKGTLSRQIKELEVELGVRLMERGSHSLRLTEEGHILHARTHGLLGEIEEVGESIGIGQKMVSGRLRISVPVLYAYMGMGSIAAAFTRSYPDIQLEITAEDRFVDLVEEGYDLVIRGNPSPDDDLVGRCFLTDDMLVVASPLIENPLNAAGRGSPLPVPAVMLSNARPDEAWRVAARDGDTAIIVPTPTITLSAHAMIRDAARAGMGAALLARSLVADDLKANRLVDWGVAQGRQTDLWILYPSRRLVNSKVSAFARFLCDLYPDRCYVSLRD